MPTRRAPVNTDIEDMRRGEVMVLDCIGRERFAILRYFDGYRRCEQI